MLFCFFLQFVQIAVAFICVKFSGIFQEELQILSQVVTRNIVDKDYPIEYVSMTQQEAEKTFDNNPYVPVELIPVMCSYLVFSFFVVCRCSAALTRLLAIAKKNSYRAPVVAHRCDDYIDITSNQPLIARTGQIGRFSITAVYPLKSHQYTIPPDDDYSVYRMQGCSLPMSLASYNSLAWEAIVTNATRRVRNDTFVTLLLY